MIRSWYVWWSAAIGKMEVQAKDKIEVEATSRCTK